MTGPGWGWEFGDGLEGGDGGRFGVVWMFKPVEVLEEELGGAFVLVLAEFGGRGQGAEGRVVGDFGDGFGGIEVFSPAVLF
jgi:hypothetical protein